MNKVSLGKNAFPYPMPMAVISAEVDGKVNHLAAAWLMRTNFSPPMLAVALGKSHFTNQGIHEKRAFGVSLPSVEQAAAVDYVGLVSGKSKDKSSQFEVFWGGEPRVPMVASAPLTMACRLVQVIDQPTNELFLAEIVEAWCDASCLSEGKPDVEKLRPFTLTMPDNRYWSVGKYVGKAWSMGRDPQG